MLVYLTVNAITSDAITEAALSGNILFPQLGTIHVAGLTVEQLQQELTSRLQAYTITEAALTTVEIIDSLKPLFWLYLEFS